MVAQSLSFYVVNVTFFTSDFSNNFFSNFQFRFSDCFLGSQKKLCYKGYDIITGTISIHTSQIGTCGFC